MTRARAKSSGRRSPPRVAEPSDTELKRLRDLVQGIDAIVWEADATTIQFSFVSQRAEAMLGYPVRQWLSEPDFWAHHIHPDDRERAVSVCQAAVARGHDHELEYRMVAADGRTVWIHDTCRVVPNAEGRATTLRGVLMDITERKRVEEKMAALLEIAKDISGTFDLDEILDRVFRRTAALLPCDRVITYYWDPQTNTFRDIARYGLPQELVEDAVALDFPPDLPIIAPLTEGRTVSINDPMGQNLVPPQVLAHFGIQALIAVPLAVRGRVLGAYVAVSTQMGGRFEPAQVELLGSIGRQVAVAIETTELYRTQQQEAKVAAALARVAQEMISSLDRPVLLERLSLLTTEVLECDCSHTLLWKPEDNAFVPVSAHGYPSELWEAMRILKLPRAMMADSLNALDDAEATQLAVAKIKVVPIRELAHEVGMTANLLMALRRGKDLIGIHAACYRGGAERFTPQQERIGQGIAQIASLALEHARLVEELEGASRLKSEFVATMSHELRTPLNVIVGYNSLLIDGAFGELPAEQADVLRRVEHSAHELLDLINATLDMSRLESGRLPLDLREVDPVDLIAEIDAETLVLREKPGVSFAWQVPAPLPHLRTDPMKLKVVLKNLIGNAVKFTDRGSVTVSVQPHADRVEFAVADSGIGVAPEIQTVIFEPFRQGDSSTTRRYGGVGLGLYIVRRLLEILGGSITLDSHPGRGSIFRVSVPLKASSQED